MSIFQRGIARTGKKLCFVGLLALSCTAFGFAQNAKLSVKLTPSTPSPSPVGQSILWTATVSQPKGRVTYRFLAAPAGAKLSLVRDFSPVNTLPWTGLTEGTYHIVVMVRDTSAEFGQTGAVYQFQSRVTGGTPVVSATANPLVALYSAPPCALGSTVQVSFWPSSDSKNTTTTPAHNCSGNTTLNFYLAGMLHSTTYAVQQTTITNGNSTPGPQLSFQTGAPNYPLLPYKVMTAPNKRTAKQDDILLMSFKAVRSNPPLYPSPTATDLAGNVLWYYWDPESPKTPQSEYLTRPVAGGTFLVLMWGGAIREVDFAGNIVRETNVGRIAEQLKAKKTDTINWLSHEALRLPNGHTVTLGSAERLLTGVQSAPGTTVDVVGDMIIDLDENFQVSWSWSSFDHLNTSRVAVLNEKCGQGGGGGGGDTCGKLKLGTIANDWTHANSLLQTSDGNLLISLRNQDYVIKVNYQNGTGDGHVIWTLGNDGSCSTPGCTSPAFTIQTPTSFYEDTFPWFSHQHDVEFDGTNYELYDNGNTRLAPAPIGLGIGDSRGYVFSVDETKMVVTVLNGVDLKSFSPGFGSAQLLSNGDYQFTNGTINNALLSQVIEMQKHGAFNYRGQWKTRSYRSFRMTDLYTYTQ